MPKQSVGLLMFRSNPALEVFLVHPGGPFWAKKNLGAWTIPKGEYADAEEPLTAARREFAEETGFSANGEFFDLGAIKQAGGKIVRVWAFEGDCEPATLVSNRFQMEWPPRSGRLAEFPEIDRGAWFSLAEAKERILASQQPILNLLTDLLARRLNTGT